MPEVKISVTFTAREYDLVRTILDEAHKEALANSGSRRPASITPPVAQEFGRRAVQLNDILGKLR